MTSSPHGSYAWGRHNTPMPSQCAATRKRSNANEALVQIGAATRPMKAELL